MRSCSGEVNPVSYSKSSADSWSNLMLLVLGKMFKRLPLASLVNTRDNDESMQYLLLSLQRTDRRVDRS
jgi:hypothetical protein